ncbi:MAG: hypothetical protein LBC27_03270 [Spirochaetaceae bacterium]|jgi:hypothetical protein|nr:hypothetical protein [Spirochaetaceae bacterium]
MSDIEFLSKLKEALDARRAWFDNYELPKLKEEFRVFHTNISILYDLFAKKGFIIEDIYKNEAKVGDLSVPPTGSFSDANKREQLGMRIAALDNELDFLVNFHGFTVSALNQDKIKIIIGIVKYIDWLHLTPDGINVTTQAVSDVVSNIRHGASDPITSKTLTDSLAALSGVTRTIINTLKLISDFNREQYKYDIRVNVTSSMSASEATPSNINKKFSQTMGGKPFYVELINELIKEDYSADSKALQAGVLQRLTVEMNNPSKTAKTSHSFKSILMEGLNSLSLASSILSEILVKIKRNSDFLENQKHGIWEFIKKLVAQITNAEKDQTIYELESIDANTNKLVREKINFNTFCSMLEKRIDILAAFSLSGNSVKKLEAMDEESLKNLFQRNIKEVENYHKLLDKFDNYFKNAVEKSSRSKINGIKPELSALKNITIKANEKLQDYNIGKEEEKQFQQLGIDN